MVERDEIAQKRCGRIIFLPTDNFGLNCDFCLHDFYTFEALRAHLNEHYPELQTNSNKKEDSNSFGSDLQRIAAPGVEDNIKGILNDGLQDDPGSSESTATLFNNKETVVSEQSKVSQRKRQPQRTSKRSKRTTPKVHDEAPSKLIKSKRVQKYVSISPEIGSSNNIKKKVSDEKVSSKLKIIKSRSTPKKSVGRPKKSKAARHQCSFCCKVFFSLDRLSDHENIHTGKRPYECRVCNKTFTTNKYLTVHVRNHGDKPHKCLLCEKSFVTPTELDYHTREKHLPDTDPRRYFPCRQCDAKFKTSFLLYYHRRKHRKTTIYKCDYCQKEFEMRQKILTHMRNHFGIKPFKCSYCPKAFTDSSSRCAHEVNCNKSGDSEKRRNLQCKFCSKKLQSQGKLDTHENSHTGKRPYKCRVCDKAFAAYNTLSAHVKLHADEKAYQCVHCEKKFVSKFFLDNHTREKHLPHTDPRRYFPCKLCDFKSISYNQYKTHNRKHQTITDIFTCDHCEKQFTNKKNILRHMETHSPIIPKCNYCQKAFVYTGSKKQHERLCSKRKVIRKIGFECKFCHKTYGSRLAHKDHETTHTGERPFKCSICSKTYTKSAALYKHFKVVHK